MRVIHTIHSLRAAAGGPSYSVPSLCMALQRRGVDVELWAQDRGGTSLGELSVRQMRRSDVTSELRKFAGQVTRLIVHDHGVWLPWNHSIARSSRHLRVPRVVSPRGMLEPWAMQYRGMKKKFAWHAYQFGDLQAAGLLHATSAAEAGNFKRLGLTSPIIEAPNGVDADAMPCAEHDPYQPERVLLFLSRIHPKKGLLDLVTAWSRVQRPGWKIRVVGADEGNHLHDVRAAVDAAGLGRVFVFTNHLDGAEKWEAYRSADLFVLPSYSENFGLVVAEALGCGLPVITTQATPWAEVADAECGWWIPTGPDALEQALRAAVQLSPAERLAMGLRGRALVRERYTWPAIARLMIEGYEGVLNPVVA